MRWKAGQAFILALLCVAGSAAAADTVVPDKPWQEAQQTLDATQSDLQTQGFVGVAKHMSELETALSHAEDAYKVARVPDANGTLTVFADGEAEALIVVIAPAAAKMPGVKSVVAVNNPYPLMSFYLGSLYNENRQPDQAVRVLDIGLQLIREHGTGFGRHTSLLMSERALALGTMKRFDEALAGYSDGLKLPTLPDTDRARLYRGRGYILTEMGRLDEAEKAYKNSLTCEPGNQRAMNELQYIDGLRKGAAPTQPIIATVPPPAQTPENSGHCATD